MNQSEYARHRKSRGLPGQTQPAVHRALREGRIQYNEHGLIDPDVADLAWARNSKLQRVARPADAGMQEVVDQEPPTNTGSGPQAYQRARAMREVYQAELVRLKVEAESGRLVERVEVERAYAATLQAFRDHMLTIPIRVAERLAAETDAEVIGVIIDAEVRRGLERCVRALDG